MTRRAPCPPAPAPLEAYVQQFDDRFASLAQRRAFRDYLHGLLLPRERNKTLTGLAGTEPDVGAQAPRAALTVVPLRSSVGRRSGQRPAA